MMFKNPFFSRVSDDWLVGGTARVLFAVSALFVIAVTPVTLGAVSVPDSRVGTILEAIIGVIGSLCIFFLWFGMWRYWVRIDISQPWLKRLSFVVLIIGLWYGAILYFLYQYLWRDGAVQRRREGGGNETL